MTWGLIMKKYIVAFLCLTAFNYSNAYIAKWEQVAIQTVRYAKASWKYHRALHVQKKAQAEAMREILACPRRREAFVKDLQDASKELQKTLRSIEEVHPHLKNRR